MRNSFRSHACLFAHICYYFYWSVWVCFSGGNGTPKNSNNKEREMKTLKRSSHNSKWRRRSRRRARSAKKNRRLTQKNWKELIKIKQSAKNFVSCTIFCLAARTSVWLYHVVSCRAIRNFLHFCLSHRHEWALRYGTFTAETNLKWFYFFFVFYTSCYVCLFLVLYFPRF